jgi:MOSC domain-containing protein
MYIAELWRYPVKSMAGERLQAADLGDGGIAGDRVVHVQDALGRVITSRTRPRLLAHRAALGPDGEPLVDGRPWRSEDVAQEVVAAAGREARLVRFDGPERFDVLPLLVATDGAIAAFGHDGRRLRPNIVIGGVEGLAERQWEGSLLRAGQVLIGVQDLRQRCVMTTFDPDTLEQDVDVLRRIHSEFGGSLALNCWVVAGGVLRVGDPVALIAEPVR